MKIMTKEELKQEAEKYVKQNYCEMCIMAYAVLFT